MISKINVLCLILVCLVFINSYATAHSSSSSSHSSRSHSHSSSSSHSHDDDDDDDSSSSSSSHSSYSSSGDGMTEAEHMEASMPFHATALDGDVRLNWALVTRNSKTQGKRYAKQELRVQVRAPRRTWIGFGVRCKEGGGIKMQNADFHLFTFADDGAVHVEDAHTSPSRGGQTRPMRDEGHQDVHRYGGSTDQHGASVWFERALVTKDTDSGEDCEISLDGWQTVLLAIGREDQGADHVSYHGPNRVHAQVNWATGEFRVEGEDTEE